jgi:rod shape-determining protein MreC
MRRFRRQPVAIISIFLLVVIAQFSFFEPVRDLSRSVIAAPAIALDASFQKVRSFLSLISSITDLSRENAQLKEENINLRSQLSNLSALKNENELLKKDLGFSKTRTDLKLVPATIINYSPAGTFQAVTINIGAKDGVVVDQAVISNGYLVGKIKKVSQSTSEVWLLSNRNLLTPVLLTEAKTSGILRGGIRGLVVDTIPVDAAVKAGDLVVTSPMEGLYPAGIAVGTVEEIISSKEAIFVSVRVASPVNIRNIQTVFVVKQ